MPSNVSAMAVSESNMPSLRTEGRSSAELLNAQPRRATALIATFCFAFVGTAAPTSSWASTVMARGWVDAARLANATREPGQWFTAGRDVGQSHYSPLSGINDRNVIHLGFAWQYRVGTRRGLEATPIVVDGIMYTSGPWGHIYALDAATGKLLWEFDPHVAGGYGKYACCDVVNRGVAVWKGRVYGASLDGYLNAIDAKTGQLLWRVNTLPPHPPGTHYYVTGAPVLAGGDIVIGYGGADFKGVRGSVSAYSLSTGEFLWRFYTVPRNPTLGPQDQPQLQAAVKTWPSRYDWSMGAGGTVWDSLAYDPNLDLVYFGTANASPYHGQINPAKYGDELYIASIVALHADTGKMAWYYQEIPGEGFDYDTANQLILTRILVAGRPRRVVMQASKDGFLYVLDRATGEFLSGKPFTYINWAKGLDPKTHEPILRRSIDWTQHPALVWPSPLGGHNWQPMSFDPTTALVYIPVIDTPMIYVNTTHLRAGLIQGNFDLAFFLPKDYVPKDLEGLYGPLPPLSDLARGGPPPISRGFIRAIEPMTGKVVWQRQTASYWDGGILSTNGNLVFQGDADGYLNVYAADTGKLLNRLDVQTAIMAAPMTYRVGAVQYVSVMAGYGGGLLSAPFPKTSAAYRFGNEGRIVTFRLGGGPTPKLAPFKLEALPALPARPDSAGKVALGEVLYNRYCSRCHVFGRGLLPDLRRSPAALSPAIYAIVLHGTLQAEGMGRFNNDLTRADVEAIYDYLVDQSWQMQSPAPPAHRRVLGHTP
jgi:quinohemoprotein ethanol dehydrogenase